MLDSTGSSKWVGLLYNSSAYTFIEEIFDIVPFSVFVFFVNLFIISCISKDRLTEDMDSKSEIRFKIEVLKKYLTSFFFLNSDKKYKTLESSFKNLSSSLIFSKLFISSFTSKVNKYIKLFSILLVDKIFS